MKDTKLVTTEALSLIKEASIPFEKAKEAIALVTAHNASLIQIIVKLCEHLNPDWETIEHITNLLELNKFPLFSNIHGDLRVDGKLQEKDSFITFLKELMK